MKDSILGCLVGAAVGDAMGSATEIRTREEIVRDFGGYVRDFKVPPMDTFARGYSAGHITDDFSIAYYTCKEIVAQKGVISEEVAQKALFDWFDNPLYNQFCGPTTKASILAMRGEGSNEPLFDEIFVHNNSRATNGAGMKTSPIALFSGGDVDKAIRIAITLTGITHGNNIALSAAGAIAAATAVAMHEDATVKSILDAGLYGAKEGDIYGRNIQTLAGPSVLKRIKLAIEIGNSFKDVPSAIDELGDVIGSGLYAAESIPTVFGLIAASKGNAVEGILGGVNIGDDTDTVATMVGGILGAYQGSEVFPAHYLEVIEKENTLDLAKLAKEMRELIK